ncbi:MAG TPA: hypothetical protein VJZ50_01130, partial [Candidatus Limnocylindrales bacterium]|nr:hypothetical protein [Candidatus Limnocylindrales bacterium]
MSRVVLRWLIIASMVLGSLVASSELVVHGQVTPPADVRGEWAGEARADIGVFPNTFSLTEQDFTSGAVRGTANAAADIIEGTFTGDTFTFTSTRPGYTATCVLLVSADGSTMSGTFTDTNGRSGTFLMH